MFKKIILSLILFIFSSFVFIDQSYAHESVNYNVNVYFFWGDGCPHCAAEKPFLRIFPEALPIQKIAENYRCFEEENYSTRFYLYKVLIPCRFNRPAAQ